MMRVIAFAVLIAQLFYTGMPANEEGPAKKSIPSMEGYTSRYHPAHISSREAWIRMQTSEGAVMLDLRSRESYDDSHVSGAVNVPFDELTGFADERLGDKDAVIICYCYCGDRGGSALSAYNLLTALGYRNVFYTEPGDEWSYEGALAAETARDTTGRVILSGDEAKAIYDAHPGAVLLDVRNEDEYSRRHIGGSVLIPVAELESRLSELPDLNTIIIVYCKGGVRSETACAILTAHGYTRVFDMQKVDNWPQTLDGSQNMDEGRNNR